MNKFFLENPNRFSGSLLFLTIIMGIVLGGLTASKATSLLALPIGLIGAAIESVLKIKLGGPVDLAILGGVILVYLWANYFPRWSSITISWMVGVLSGIGRDGHGGKMDPSILHISWLDGMPIYILWLQVVPTIILFTLAYKYGHKKYMKRWEAAKLAIQAEADAHKTCPHCAEVILAEAKVCKHCGRDI